MESSIKYPRFRWFVFFTMCFATLAQGVVMIAPTPLVGEIAHTLGVDLGTVTAGFMALFNLALGIGGILGGFLLDRIGIAKSFLIGLILMTVGTILVPVFGTSLQALIILRIIAGLGAGPIMGAVARIASEWFPVNERAVVSGTQGMSLSLGIAVGFIFAPAVFSSTHSWSTSLASTVIFIVISIIFTLVVLFGPKPPKVTIQESTKVNAKSYFGIMITWTCVISSVLLCWCFSAFNDLTPGYIAIPSPVGLGRGPVAAGQIMTIYQIAYMVGSLLSGVLVQKLFGGKERPVIIMSFVMTAIFTFSVKFPFVTESSLFVVCLILAGFFMSMANPAIFSYISKKYPEEVTGKIGGLAMGVGIFGSSIGVLIGSVALGKTGNYQMSIALVSIVAVIGVINALTLSERKSQRIEMVGNRSTNA